VLDAAAAWYFVTVRAEAMEAAPRMMVATKRLKNLFIIGQIQVVVATPHEELR
jgi:hypothetical protein